ncbi:hypothetical protein LIER_10267 [Lithospermum erythrorhizon]|uniref:Uncharacterized protein n=1 Tax=Lithospermum erythrorhizon TaxID=34254 RepID=A0AAV3PNM0_LITER
MSHSSNSRPEGQGYNSDTQASSSPQVSSSLAALAKEDSSGPAKAIRADLQRYGSELSEKDLVEMRIEDLLRGGPEKWSVPSCTPLDRGGVVYGSVGPAQLTPNMWFSILGFYSACLLAGVTPTTELFHLLLPTYPEGWLPLFHGERSLLVLRSTRSLLLPLPAKDKADAHAFSLCWEDHPSLPLYFFTDHHVLKAAGLFPIAEADLGVLEALRVSFSVPDQTIIVCCARPHAPKPVEVRSSSKEGEALSPLLRRSLSLDSPPLLIRLLLLFSPGLLVIGLTPLSRRHLCRILRKRLPSLGSWELIPLRVLWAMPPFLHMAGPRICLLWLRICLLQQIPRLLRPGRMLAGIILPPWSWVRKIKKRLGSPIANPWPAQLLRRLEEVPPPSSTTLNHDELISSLFELGSKFFDLHGVALQSYKALLSSFEVVSGTSSRVGQLEDELRVLREEKGREEGVLRHLLKVLSVGQTVLQGRCEAAARRVEVAKASLEGMEVERDATGNERDILRAGEVARHSSRMLEKSIQVVQAKLDEAELEVPSSLWDTVRDDVSSPDPPSL